MHAFSTNAKTTSDGTAAAPTATAAASCRDSIADTQGDTERDDFNGCAITKEPACRPTQHK